MKYRKYISLFFVIACSMCLGFLLNAEPSLGYSGAIALCSAGVVINSLNLID